MINADRRLIAGLVGMILFTSVEINSDCNVTDAPGYHTRPVQVLVGVQEGILGYIRKALGNTNSEDRL